MKFTVVKVEPPKFLKRFGFSYVVPASGDKVINEKLFPSFEAAQATYKTYGAAAKDVEYFELTFE